MNARLPIVQSIPHGGLLTPPEVADRLAIDDVAIYNECDLWVDQIYDFDHPDLADLKPAEPTATTLGSVRMPIARVLIDANRAPDSLDDRDGAVKTTTSYGDPIYHNPLSRQEQIDLRQRYWRPFHDELDEVVRRHASEMRLFLDCHNMAQRGPDDYGDAGKVRPLICIANFGNRRGELVSSRGPLTAPPQFLHKAAEIAHDLFSDLALLEPNPEPTPVVGLNSPFPGGYILRRYTGDLYQPAGQEPYFGLMVEINRGLIVGNQRTDTPIQPPNEERIAAVRRRLYRWLLALLAEQ
ncbi:MAG: N-formylglutamate amidohydrolase [Caldilineaceae bacterium]|nr:N-formylglutamate amidohydrolase [Caldilineaceae bacterium]